MKKPAGAADGLLVLEMGGPVLAPRRRPARCC